MGSNVLVQGSVEVNPTLCPPGPGIDQTIVQLGLGTCGTQGVAYSNHLATKVDIATTGVVGNAFVSLPLGQFSAIEFLYLFSSARIRLRYTLPDASTTISPDIEGLCLQQFARGVNAPTAIEASGIARISIVAAGNPA